MLPIYIEFYIAIYIGPMQEEHLLIRSFYDVLISYVELSNIVLGHCSIRTTLLEFEIPICIWTLLELDVAILELY